MLVRWLELRNGSMGMLPGNGRNRRWMRKLDELLSECEKYFEKVIKDFNQNRKGRNLRKKQRNGCSHVITKHLFEKSYLVNA